MSVVILNPGIGNIRSVENWLKRLLIEYSVLGIGDDANTTTSTIMIMPGVGDSVAYANRISRWEWAVETIQNRRFGRLIGICAGFQVLCNHVYERGRDAEGLGVIPAISKDQTLSTAHNGWTEVDLTFLDAKRLRDVPRQEVFFNHACCVIPSCSDDSFSMDKLGFATQYLKGNIIGMQYHPEKSGALGDAIGTHLLNV